MPYKWSAFLVVALGTSLGTFDLSGLNVALPTFARLFRVTPETALWVVLAYILTYTGCALTAGRAADMVGRKRVYTLGLFIVTLGLVLSSMAQELWQLIGCRVVQGMGAAMLVSNSNALLTDAFPAKERGKAIGLLESVVGAGLMVGPVVSGMLLDFLDWRAIFYVRIPVALAATLLAWSVLRETAREGPRPRFDFPGSLTLIGGLVCLTVAINQGPRAGWGSPVILGLAGAAAGLLGGFLFVEARVRQPVVALALFRDRVFSAYNAVLLTYFIPFGGIFFLFPFYLMHGLGYSASTAGLFLTVAPLFLFLLSPAAGTLSDRIGSWRITIAGLAFTLLGFFLLSRLGGDASALHAVTGLGLLGFGAGLLLTPAYSAVLGATPPARLGTSSALIATLRNIGLSLGQASSATILAIRRTAHEAALPGTIDDLDRARLGLVLGFQDAVLVSTAIVAAGLFIALAFGRQ